MTTRPWMPLYVGDYLADTAHLRALEHGGYLLLIMHYWRTGGLPDDDAQLARITRMTGAEWKRARPVIQPLFQDGWKHKRVEFEMTQAAIVSAAGRVGGKASAEARRAKSVPPSTNDQSTTVERPLNEQPNDPSTNGQALHSQRKKDAAKEAAPENSSTLDAQVYQRGKQVLGPTAGGLIKRLIVSKDGNLALARAAIETASTKNSPREYLAAIINGKEAETKDWRSAIL